MWNHSLLEKTYLKTKSYGVSWWFLDLEPAFVPEAGGNDDESCGSPSHDDDDDDDDD